MHEDTAVALTVVIFAWAIVSRWLGDHLITGPLMLTAAGLFLANPSWGVVSVDLNSSTIHHLAEATLALLLFSDASSVPVAAARRDVPLTGRLLGIGLPLSIIAGTAIAVVLFPNVPLALAGLVAASLAPTDAALSADVIADERLPIRVRRVLNVESGLNDGIATPVVTVFIASTATAIGLATHEFDAGWGALGELVVGAAIGAGLGLIGGMLIIVTRQQGWTKHGSRRMATLSLALMAFFVASAANGNPFVAAFVGGLVFGASAQADAKESIELTELTGSYLSLVVWFVFGAGFVLPAFEQIDWRIALYAIASLTVVRMVPVAISLIGSGETAATTAFIGWFGPRGLASVVFALLASEQLGDTDPRVVSAVHTIAITITLSIVAHGVTARPWATRYVAAVQQHQTAKP